MLTDAATRERFTALLPDDRPPDGCWPWQGTITAKGYGQLAAHRRSIRAHRLAYLLAKGPIPAGTMVCHTCDNRRCVNPAHLYAGTNADNQRDKAQRHRSTRGERNRGGGKLTEADVRAIRQALAAGDTKTAVGARFGVSRTEVGYIASGRHWGHVR